MREFLGWRNGNPLCAGNLDGLRKVEPTGKPFFLTKGAKLFICNLADLFAAWDQAIACERYIDAAELPVGERDAVEIVAYGLAVISASQAVFDDLVISSNLSRRLSALIEEDALGSM